MHLGLSGWYRQRARSRQQVGAARMAVVGFPLAVLGGVRAGVNSVSRPEARQLGRCNMSVELSIEGVSLSYGKGSATTVALEDVTLSVEHGEFVTIVGASGCGKSSLLNLVAGFLRPSRGQLLLGGASIE